MLNLKFRALSIIFARWICFGREYFLRKIVGICFSGDLVYGAKTTEMRPRAPRFYQTYLLL